MCLRLSSIEHAAQRDVTFVRPGCALRAQSPASLDANFRVPSTYYVMESHFRGSTSRAELPEATYRSDR